MTTLPPILPALPDGGAAAQAARDDDALDTRLHAARRAPRDDDGPPAPSPEALAAAAQWLQQPLPAIDPGPLACQDLSASPSVATATPPADEALPSQREHILELRETTSQLHAAHAQDSAGPTPASTPASTGAPTAASESWSADGDSARDRDRLADGRTDAG